MWRMMATGKIVAQSRWPKNGVNASSLTLREGLSLSCDGLNG